MTTLAEKIADLENRVVNAPSVEVARSLHDQLDVLRELDELREHKAASLGGYERGYQAGYHAAMRKAEREAHPPCDHKGIGFPWCSTCAPRTLARIAEMEAGASLRAETPE